MNQLQALGVKLTDEQAMQMALAVARGGEGRVAPNPLVGCVILDKDGKFLSSGYHARVGGAHAEIEALNHISDKSNLEGAQVFVTLEPCAHHGRTPPCADALAQLPIDRVVYGIEDPFEKVSGKGLAILRSAGKRVERSAIQKEVFEDLVEVFLCNQTLERSFVAIKVATTLDGQVADQMGHSRWITSELSRQEVHRLRGCYDGILVGANTFLKDNPSLNVRHPQFQDKENTVFVVDPSGELLERIEDSNLLKSHSPTSIIWLVKTKRPCSVPVKQWEVSFGDDDFPVWHEVLKRTRENGVYSILVEGGARTIGSLMKQKLVDRYFQFFGPSLMGGNFGYPLAQSWGPTKFEDRIRLIRPTWSQIGEDMLLSGRPTWS